MPSDRPGDVTRRLTALEATVRGLTQELVEANERLRQLEAQLEPDDEPKARNKDRESDTDAEPDSDADPIETDDIIIA